MDGIIYFITSLLILVAGVKRFRRATPWRSIGLIIISIFYTLFCFIAMGKLQGFIASQEIITMIQQQGYHASALKISIEKLVKIGLTGGILFNVYTAIWIWLRGGLWKYCLVSIVLYCIAGMLLSPIVGLPPFQSLYGICCGFMASVGWVLGLSYIEFCVIGNIYVPAATIFIASAYLIYKGIRMRNPVVRFCSVLFGVLQMSGAALVVIHYFGSYSYAFYQCVSDLSAGAKYFGISYKSINLVIYVVGIPLLFFSDIFGRENK